MIKSKLLDNKRLVIYEDEIKMYEFYFSNCNRDFYRIDNILSHLLSIKRSVGTYYFKLGYNSMKNSYISLLLFNDSQNIGYSLFETNYFLGNNTLITNNIFTEEDYNNLFNPIFEYWNYFKQEKKIYD